MQLISAATFQLTPGPIRSAVATGTRRVLSRFGYRCMRDAKSSIVKRAAASIPGRPPSAHLPALRKIRYAYSATESAVYIGPVLLAGGDRRTLRRIELGGRTIIHGKSVRYAPRPFMVPAFKRTAKILPQLLTDAIK